MARLVYEKYHKDLVLDSNHTVVDYTCCPGWTQVSWRSHGCNKPVCSIHCANGGTCVAPNSCSCPPGYEGTYCETKTSVYAPANCTCYPQVNTCVPQICPVLRCPPCPCGRNCYCSCRCIQPCTCCTCLPLCTTNSCGGDCNCISCAPCTCSCSSDSSPSPASNPSSPRKRTKHNGLQDDETGCNPPCRNGGTCSPAKVCVCRSGYKGSQCEEDVNECKILKPCDQICYNVPGSYKCECKETFTLQPDGQTCRREDADGNAWEARDLEAEQSRKFDKMDKRLQKLEKLIKEKSKNEVTKKDIEGIQDNIDKLSDDISNMSTRIEDLASIRSDMAELKSNIEVLNNGNENINNVNPYSRPSVDQELSQNVEPSMANRRNQSVNYIKGSQASFKANSQHLVRINERNNSTSSTTGLFNTPNGDIDYNASQPLVQVNVSASRQI